MGFFPKAEMTGMCIFKLTTHLYCDPRGKRLLLSSHYNVHKSSGGLCHEPGLITVASQNKIIWDSLTGSLARAAWNRKVGSYSEGKAGGHLGGSVPRARDS